MILNQTRLYGILVDISGSMKESYKKLGQQNKTFNSTQELDQNKLNSVWNFILKVIQNNDLKNDYIFLSAFGCENEVDVIDLIPFIASIINTLKLISQIKGLKIYKKNNEKDYYTLLHNLVSENGAPNLHKFYKIINLKENITQFKAQLLYHELNNNKSLLKAFIEQLPSQVKINNTKHKIEAFFATSYNNPLKQIIQRYITQYESQLDNYISYDTIFQKIEKCLNVVKQELISYNNNEISKIQQELVAIMNSLKNNQQFQTSQQNLEKLENILQQLASIYKEILNILHKKSFNPQKIIQEQTNLQQISIKSVKSLIELIGIGQEGSKIRIDIEDLNIFKQFESIAYGGTPLYKCLELTLNSQFQQFNNKFLFIVSDGDSTDGNPIEKANQLKAQGFTIFSYYITTSMKITQNQLYSRIELIKGDGAKAMFEMSSEKSNFEFPLRCIEKYTNIKLSEEGKSRLFLQGNDPQQFQQFFDYFVKISQDNDKLIEIIWKITLEKYINSSEKFEAKQQNGGSCYANAIAAAYSIILSQKNQDYPGFFFIREILINKYGINGAYTFQVVQQTCDYFGLKYRQIKSVSQIKQVLHQGRPIIARFELCEDQWDADNDDQIGFNQFFRKNPTGILENVGPQSNKKKSGHVVILKDYTNDYYTFINSWGIDWGDKGYFRLKDLNVLNMEFIEIYYDYNDLTEVEKQMFKNNVGIEITNFYQNHLSCLGNIQYRCVNCNSKSKIKEYKGNYNEAECPKCNKRFQPEALGKLFADYIYKKNR